MPETPQASSQQNKEAKIDKPIDGNDPPLQVSTVRLPSGLRWILIFGGVFLVALLLVSILLPNLAERVKFFTVNALSLLVLLVIVVQTFIYRRQWQVMENQGEAMQYGLQQTDRVIEKMQGQLDAIDKQAETMIEQKKVMEKQLNVMVSQANLFIESLEETRKIWMQNERHFEANRALADDQMENMKRQLSAAELSAQAAQSGVEVMRESHIASMRAYIGIRKITISPLAVGEIPTVFVTWHNGGRTPAAHFRAVVYLVVGDKPERRGYFLDDDWSESEANFLPPGIAANPVEYTQVQIGFKPMTQERLNAIKSGKTRLYAMIDAVYTDFMEQQRTFDSGYIFDEWEGIFTELYEYATEKQS